jgi:hypothetical protein
MNFQFHLDPFVGWTWIAVAGALGLILVAAMAYRRMRGTVLRLATLALLLGALANPILRQDERDYLPDIAAIVVDESDSQSFAGRSAQTEAATKELLSQIASLPKTETRVVRVKTGESNDTDGSRAFAAMRTLMADIPPEQFAGAIMLTDGQIHDVPLEADLSKLRGPLHALISGSKADVDRRIVVDYAPRFALAGKPQTIRFHVEDGDNRASVDVTITADGGQQQVISAVPNAEQQLEITVDHAGANIIELSVPELPGEISQQNNRAMAIIDGVRDRLRVLLVSGEPHPGERTWRNLLKSDAAVDLIHFTILRPPEKQDGTPTKELSLIAFPTRELFIDKIEEFDLIIFDRYRRQAIVPDGYLANIADYVRRGGAVLISSGPDLASGDGLYESSMADVIAAAPTGTVVEEPFQPAVTADGMKHPVTRNLPSGGAKPTWGKWFRVVDTATTEAGVTLMSAAGDRPLLVLARQGEGRVAQLLSDHGWLWARGYDGGGPQIELLRRIAHWLMKEPELEEEALVAAQVGKSVRVERRTMADDAKPIVATLPSGKTETLAPKLIEPGIFEARLEAKETGVYRFSDGTLTTAAAIGNVNNKEFSDLRATDALLAPALRATGGVSNWLEAGLPRVFKVAEGRPMAGSGWIGLRENGVFRVTAVRSIPLYSSLLSLAAVLLVLAGMWYREGR